MPQEAKKPTRIWPVVRAYTRATLRYPWTLLIGLIGLGVMQYVDLATPLYLKRLVDTLSESSPTESTVTALTAVIVAYAGLSMVKWVATRVQRASLTRMEAKVMSDLANYGFDELFTHGHDFFISNFAGTLTRRVTRFARSYEQVYDSLMFNFIPLVVFSAGSVSILYARNPVLGVTLLVWVLGFIAVQLVVTRWRQPLRVARAIEDSKITGSLSDAVGNHTAITLFAADAHERTIFRAIVDRWYAATMRSWNSDSIINGIQHFLGIAIEVALLWIGVVLWQRGLVTVGDFILIQIYVIGLFDQVWSFGNNIRRLYDAFADASEMIDIIELPRAIVDAPQAPALTVEHGAINFDSVGFYFTPDRPILKDLALDIAGGEKIALVGPSGAGKSTVIKLLLRQYDVSEGTVRVDGQDVREVTQDSLHEAIAFVPQEPALFHRTLRENILYGRRDATEEEMVAAAKAAHCHEFISALPEGYNTYVGERGVKLSGGERQRVAIARAILKNAPILVLDEATSSLDSESEALIQDALAKLMEGKTVIAIAHR
ncbi:MAG: ABC transporter ATP-binding protein, partial [Candidatus Paceibacterota bacterium]